MSGVLGQCIALYRELIKVGIDPGRADELEIWQIAALMEVNGHETPDETSTRFLRERVRAAREGRDIDAEELVQSVSEIEVQRMLSGEGVITSR